MRLRCICAHLRPPARLPPTIASPPAEWRKRYGDEVSIFKWCREGLPEEVPQLQQVLKLESRKPRPARGLTVVTQLSLERFQMLENQCTTWPLQAGIWVAVQAGAGRPGMAGCML